MKINKLISMAVAAGMLMSTTAMNTYAMPEIDVSEIVSEEGKTTSNEELIAKIKFDENKNAHIYSNTLYGTGYIWYTAGTYYTTDLNKYKADGNYVLWEVTSTEENPINVYLTLSNSELTDIELGFYGNYTVINPTGAIKRGDINCDNKVSIADAVTLNRIVLRPFSEIKPWSWGRANLNSDNTVDVFDIMAMRKLIIENSGL